MLFFQNAMKIKFIPKHFLAPPVLAVSDLTSKFWFQFPDAIVFLISLSFFHLVMENTHVNICLSIQGY
jgi:hypothetical protein